MDTLAEAAPGGGTAGLSTAQTPVFLFPQNWDEASASSLICHCPLPPSRAAESSDPLSLHPHGAISPLTPSP